MPFTHKQPVSYFIFLLLYLHPFSANANRKLTTRPFSSSGERNVILKISYKVAVKGHLDMLRLKIIIPQSIKNRQVINDVSFSHEPDSFYNKNGNKYALYKLYDVNENIKITMTCDATIFRFIDSANHENDSNFIKYLSPEPFIESKGVAIEKVATTLKQNTDIETVMKTYFYVKEHVSYERNRAIGADSVLEKGVGKCMDFSDLFNALLRANNIPAKSMYGIVVTQYSDWPYHAWSEVYLKRQGWVLFDPTSGHTDITLDGKNFKMKIANKYILTSEGRNDPELHVQLCNYQWWGERGSSAKLKIKIETEPN